MCWGWVMAFGERKEAQSLWESVRLRLGLLNCRHRLLSRVAVHAAEDEVDTEVGDQYA